tara:strand:+ start:2098 stop:3627 length:1530 start_codon:yes stop_codon:yes gene_type:complete
MHAQTIYDVVIVGLGPAGTLISLLLSKYDLKILCLDKDKEIFRLPRAITIDDEGLRTMQKLNLDHIYTANSTQAEGAYFLDNKLQTLSGVKFPKNFITKHGWHPASMFHQPFTDKLLREELIKSKSEIKLGHELINLNQKDEIYCLEVMNLTSGKSQELKTTYVIGADGASSKVRKLKDIKQEDLDYDKEWLVVDIELLRKNDELPKYAAQICDPKRLSTYIPAHLPFRRWEFILLDGERNEDIEKEEVIHKLIQPWLEPEEYKIIRSAVYRFHSLISQKFHSENCFLIGDAAHQNPPFMGQGMMSGYRDALNLSWKLGSVIEGILPAKVLNSYEEERLPHSKFVVKGSAAIGKLMSAYSDAIKKGNLSSVPEKLVQKGYGSYSLPPLNSGLLFQGRHNPLNLSGEHFPQIIKVKEDCLEKQDALLGDHFSLVSKDELILDQEDKEFLLSIRTNMVNLEDWMIEDNNWIARIAEKNNIFLVRPDKIIFGSASNDQELKEVIRDLKNRLI